MRANRILFYFSQLFVCIAYFFVWSIICRVLFEHMPNLPGFIEIITLVLLIFLPIIQLIGVVQYKSKFILYTILFLFCISLIPLISRLMYFIRESLHFYNYGYSHYSGYPPSDARDYILFISSVAISIYILQSKIYTKLYRIQRFKILIYLPLLLFCGLVFYTVYQYFTMEGADGLLR